MTEAPIFNQILQMVQLHPRDWLFVLGLLVDIIAWSASSSLHATRCSYRQCSYACTQMLLIVLSTVNVQQQLFIVQFRQQFVRSF